MREHRKQADLINTGIQQFPHAVLNVIVTAIGGEDSIAGAARFERDVLALRPAVVTIDYALNDRWVLVGGYRYMEFDREIDGRDFSMDQSGVLFGATYKF